MAKPLSVYKVFTPTTPARINFIPREAINDQLVDALCTPGKQLIVYGETGSGKSTLLLNKLHETYSAHITTQCSAATSYEQLLLDAFDQLDEYYVKDKKIGRSRTVSTALTADFLRIRASLNSNRTRSAEQSQTRIVPPQLTAQRLAQFLGAQGICWVVEDFHKMANAEKLLFAQSMKVFSDASAEYPEVKTVTIGATETARQVVEFDREMFNRVSELLVPLMTDDELAEIIYNGQRLLNIDLSEFVYPIVQYSVGVPSICHQLALNTCLESGLLVSQNTFTALTKDNLKLAVERYVRESSDTLKASFEKALKRYKVKKFDNSRLILAAIAKGPFSGVLFADILATIRESEPHYPAGNLVTYLNELRQERRGYILRAGADGRYRYADPLYHTFAQLTLLPESQLSTSTSLVGSIAKATLLDEIEGSSWVSYVLSRAGQSTHDLGTPAEVNTAHIQLRHEAEESRRPHALPSSDGLNRELKTSRNDPDSPNDQMW